MIRSWVFAAVFGAQAAVACPVPPDALALIALDKEAPAGFARFDKPPLSAPFDIEIEFCNLGNQAVEQLEFDAIMPAHQHGMNYQVEISSTASNRFLVSNVVFHMPGSWRMSVAAELGGKTFIYEAEVPLK